MPQTTEARVRAAIIDLLDVHETEVTPTASLSDDLGCDSLDKVNLIMKLEDEFNRSFPDEETAQLDTLSGLVSYINERVYPSFVAADRGSDAE